MFFDCTGLMAGLVASVITKWKANDKYSYGYVRAEILAGFVNGLFLLFISFFLMSEAVERAIEPPEVRKVIQFYLFILTSSFSIANCRLSKNNLYLPIFKLKQEKVKIMNVQNLTFISCYSKYWAN